MKCAIISCSSRKNDMRHGISFHKIPTDEIVKTQWLKAIRQENLRVNEKSLICSVHFRDKDIISVGRRNYLTKDAFPMLALTNDRMEKKKTQNSSDDVHCERLVNLDIIANEERESLSKRLNIVYLQKKIIGSNIYIGKPTMDTSSVNYLLSEETLKISRPDPLNRPSNSIEPHVTTINTNYPYDYASPTSWLDPLSRPSNSIEPPSLVTINTNYPYTSQTINKCNLIESNLDLENFVYPSVAKEVVSVGSNTDNVIENSTDRIKKLNEKIAGKNKLLKQLRKKLKRLQENLERWSEHL